MIEESEEEVSSSKHQTTVKASEPVPVVVKVVTLDQSLDCEILTVGMVLEKEEGLSEANARIEQLE